MVQTVKRWHTQISEKGEFNGGTVLKAWEGLKEPHKGWYRTPGLATVGTMATPWSERTSAGSG